MNMEGPWRQPFAPGTVNGYQYNGKELNGDLGLNWNDYGARWYNGAVGRWNGVDRFAEKYHSLTTYHYGANNPIKFIDINGDSLKVNFIGKYDTHAQNLFSGIINYSLEGQFRVTYKDQTCNKDNDMVAGTIEIVPFEKGNYENLSENGKAFYDELTNIVNDGYSKIEINVDYARSDIATGNFNNGTIDMADVMQFNKNLSDLGGTQGGKIIHEIVEQYWKQAQKESFDGSHAAAIQSENNVNLSVRRDKGEIQDYTGDGGRIMRNIISFKNRRVINVTKIEIKK